MTEYTSSIELALRLITKKGRNMTHRHLENDVLPDADRPWDKAAPLPADQVVKAVTFNMKVNLVNGTTVLKGDRQLLVAAKGLNNAPGLKDIFWDQGSWWRVVDKEELQPGEEMVLYTLQVRR